MFPEDGKTISIDLISQDRGLEGTNRLEIYHVSEFKV